MDPAALFLAGYLLAALVAGRLGMTRLGWELVRAASQRYHVPAGSGGNSDASPSLPATDGSNMLLFASAPAALVLIAVTRGLVAFA